MSIFSRIIAGEIPCYKIYENEKVFAFLDIHPLTKGHTLLVPKIEVDYFAEVPADYAQELFLVAQKIALALDRSMWSKRTQLVIAGWDVPHTHLHLVPSENMEDIRKTQTLELSESEMLEIQQKILAELEK